MSEKIYAVLLRLFPSRFRESYGEDALQLFRDRARHETGLFPRLRLWVDLIADLAISLPREYRYPEPALAAATLAQRANAAPSPTFFVLPEDSPRPGALVIGGILSLCAVLALSALLSRASSRKPLRAASNPSYRAASALSRSYAQRAPEASYAASTLSAPDTLVSPPQEQLATSSGAFAAKDGTSYAPSVPSTVPSPAFFFANSFSPLDTTAAAPVPQPRDTAKPPRALTPAPSNYDLITEHRRIVDAAVSNLNRYYVDPVLAREMSDVLQTHEENGDDNAATAGPAFAALLTKQMRDVSHDRHLDLIYSEQPLPDHAAGPSAEALARYRGDMQRSNCTFEEIELLPKSIGYLKLDSFPELSVCGSTATAAMRRLNGTDALIFDLRDNTGGFPDMVSFLAAYLFDYPTYFYNPRENVSEQSWTPSPIASNHLADKPVYVLTSSATSSGAEQLCYNLKMLKRATLVGETTRGVAHATAFHRLDDHFGMGIPETKPINPYGTPDWEGTGVAPDIQVPAARALQTALKMARSNSRKK